ncbi:hypothetical protein CER18_09515, partial [Bartonella tribocorum]
DSKDRTLSGVKAAEKDNEAVNKKQLEDSLKGLSKDLQSDDSAVVHYDKTNDESGTINYGSITFGKGKDSPAVALHNVADGAISSGSHDAINGKQINKIGEDIAKYLGGGAAFSGGAFIEPSYGVHDIRTNGEISSSQTVHNDVGSALSALDHGLGNVNTRITNTIKDFDQKITDSSQHIEKDALLWNDGVGAFVARHEKSKGPKGRAVATQENSKITFLSDGNVSKDSTDAVTGGQLYSLNERLASYLGGGSGYSENGQWTAPTFTVKTVKDDGNSEEMKYNTVAEALTGVGASFTNVQNKITNEITNQINHLQSEDSAVVHYDKAGDESGTVNYESITFGGKDKTATALHNVADGAISKHSHDAVTGGQIHTIGEEVAKYLGGGAAFSGGAFTGPTYKLSSVSEEGRVKPKDFNDVGSAFTGLDDNIKNVNKRIKEVSQGVAQDSLNWSKESNAFLAQHGDKEENSKITSLKGGVISFLSTDAINGSQLYALGSSVAQYFGGDANYKDGAWSAPAFKFKTVKEDGVSIEDKEYSTVAEAFTGVGSSFEKLQKEFSRSITNITQEVQGDALLWSETDKAFVAQHGKDGAKTASKIKYLANGDISAASTEAITGSQLYGLGSSVAQYFGGGASYENGAWSAPSFKVKTVKDDGTSEEKVYQTVAEALEGVGSSITNVKQEINNEITTVVSDSLIKQAKDGAPITIGKEVEGTIINLQNKNNENRSLSGLIGGTISKDSHEAVNGSQLYETNDKVATYLGGGSGYKEGQWIDPTFTVKTVTGDGKEENKTYKNVAEAFEGVGASITNVQNKITNEITNQINHLQSDDSVVVHYDKAD